MMLITAFEQPILGPKVAEGVGSLNLTDCPVGFDHNVKTH